MSIYILLNTLSDTSIRDNAWSTDLTWTIKGSKKYIIIPDNGLPFALKIFLTAISFKAFAPKPYTVSK